MIRLLLDKGADVNASDRIGGSPLVGAAQQRPQNVVALLAAGADPNQADAYGCSPLYFACGNGQPGAAAEAVQQLLAAGADPKAANCEHA